MRFLVGRREETLSSLYEAFDVFRTDIHPRSWTSIVRTCQAVEVFGSDCTMRVGGIDRTVFNKAIYLLLNFNNHILFFLEETEHDMPTETLRIIGGILERTQLHIEALKQKRDDIALIEQKLL